MGEVPTTPNARREYICRRHEEGLTFRAIADNMGISTGRVSELYHQQIRRRAMAEQTQQMEGKLESLNLNIRTLHALKRVGMTTIQEALDFTTNDFLFGSPGRKVRNFGVVAQLELVSTLADRGHLMVPYCPYCGSVACDGFNGVHQCRRCLRDFVPLPWWFRQLARKRTTNDAPQTCEPTATAGGQAIS